MSNLIKAFVFLCLILGLSYFLFWCFEAETQGLGDSVRQYNETQLKEYLQDEHGWGGMYVITDKLKCDGEQIWHVNGMIERFDKDGVYYRFNSVIKFCGHKDTYYASHMEMFEMQEFTIVDEKGNKL